MGMASETRERLMVAAIETLRHDGITGTSARAIARRGGFNQALIFYHFGSVTNLLIGAALAHSADAVARYRERATGVTSLADLVTLARHLHAEDLESGSVTVVTQLMAGAAHDPALAGAVMESFSGWIEIVELALKGALGQTPLAQLLPRREAAFAISAMFLGMELLSRLGETTADPETVFTMMGSLASVIEGMPVLLGQGTP